MQQNEIENHTERPDLRLPRHQGCPGQGQRAKAADRLQGVAAETVTERVAAKIVLSELTVGELTENPTVPYEKDEVTRVNLDGLNQPTYQRFKGMTIGELREWILDHKTTGDDLVRSCRAFTGEVAAAVAKLMSAMDLVYGASKIHHITRCNTTIGQPGVLAFRNQPNSPTDDPEEILIQMMEGVSYGCGDACMGINPVENNVESTRRIADAVYSFICRNDIPTQLVVLSHMTTQMDAIRKGAPLSMIFQSIAGTEAANNDFGVSRQLCTEAYELACQHALSTGPNLLYFETGQGSEVSIGADCGVDEMTLEARTYGFGRFFRPFMVNNVSGFIGPETLYDGKEMIRASLEDHFMGKLMACPWAWPPATPTTPPLPRTSRRWPPCCSTPRGPTTTSGCRSTTISCSPTRTPATTTTPPCGSSPAVCPRRSSTSG